MASNEDKGQTIKQLRGQISALARENKMLNHKMSLLEENATLKQNTMLSSFLTWMEDNGIKPKEEIHRRKRDSKSPTVLLSVKQEPISTELPSRSHVRDDARKLSTASPRKKSPEVRNRSKFFHSEPDKSNAKSPSSKKEVPPDVGLGQSLEETRLTGSPDIVNNHFKGKSSERNPNDFNVVTSTPVKSPFGTYENSILPETEPWYRIPPSDYDPYFLPENESAVAESPDIRDYWLRRQDKNGDHAQLRSTPITSTPKKLNTSYSSKGGADNYGNLKDKVGSLLEETRRAASPDMGVFADDEAPNDSRPVTSTPTKTPLKRVMFADEMNENAPRSRGDPISSVPRPYNCDPLNLFTPGKTSGSTSRQLSYSKELSSPADVNGFVDSRDEQSFRRLTLNDRPDSRARRRSGTSKRPISSRKDDRHHVDSKNKSPRSKGARENYSANRDMSFNADDKRSPRPSVNVDKLFDSWQNGYLKHEPVKKSEYQATYLDDHTSLSGGSRSKRSRYEYVTNTSPGLTSMPKSPSQLKSQRPRNTSNVEFDVSNDDKTIDILENELQGIYKQNLDDEIKITEIRRNAVRRFDNWRDVMESEMVKLDNDGRYRLAKNIDMLSHSLPTRLKCDCSTGFDGNSKSVAISEGRLSELEDGSELGLVSLEESRNESLDRSATETSLKTEPASQNLEQERKRSIDSQTESPKSVFMARPDTIIFGEIAFQLERVVLSRVFRGGSKQLTGYTLSNMEKMIESHYDYRERPMIEMQLEEVKDELHICGWNYEFHPKLVAHLIEKFGTFPTNVKAKSAARKRGWTEPQALKEEVLWRIPKKYIHDMIIILDCLFYLSKKYDIPLFTW